MVEEIIGAPKNTVVNSLVSAISDKKWSEALSVLRHATEAGGDMTLLSKLLIVKLRAILMLSIDPKADFSKTFSEEDIIFAKKIAAGKNISAATLVAFLSAHEHIASAPMPELPLELAIISLAEKGNDQSLFS